MALQEQADSYTERRSGLKHYAKLSEPEQSKLATEIAHLADDRVVRTFQNMARNSAIVNLKKAGFGNAYISRKTGNTENVVSRAIAEHPRNRRIVAKAVKLIPTPPNPQETRPVMIGHRIYPKSCPRCTTGAVRLAFDPNVAAHTLDCLMCAFTVTQAVSQVVRK